MKQRGIHIIWIVFALFLQSNFSYAGERSIIKVVSGHEIEADTVPILLTDPEDTVVGLASYEYQLKLIYGRELHSDVDTRNDWNVRVIYQIASLGGYFAEDTLNVNNIDPLLIDLNIHNINEPEASIQITQVSLTEGNASDRPTDIHLECIQTKRTEQIASIPQIDHKREDEYLHIYWNFSEGAEQYELQWLFIDQWDAYYNTIDETTAFDQAEINTPWGNTSTEGRHYKDPVKILTSNQDYKVHLSYPTGKLYYRIRPLGTFEDGSQSIHYGTWSSPQSFEIGNNTNPAFEADKIWQTVTTYSENGKNKKVLSYYDPSMRNRQSLTYVNSHDIVIAAEQFYDYEGRSSLQVLPAVLEQSSLSYQTGLNISNATSQAYDKADFDQITPAPSLSTSSGAAQYFSSDNTTNQLNRDYIPSDDGHVFTQTLFKRDGTGRPVAVSGIGSNMQLESQRETKYYYGSTNSTELRRLFGSNVGIASHYKKNMIKDPNGQLSIQYVDQENRTIGTALTGKAPNNVDSLSYTAPLLTANLNENNIWQADGLTKTATFTLFNVLPDGATDYHFVYDFEGIINESGVPFNLCQTCQYELTISIKDPEGNYLTIPHADFNTTTQQIEAFIQAPDNYTCQNETFTWPSIQFTMNFMLIGDYTITKRLRVLSHDTYLYFDTVLQQIDTAQLFQNILTDHIQSIDSTHCNFTCQQHFETPCAVSLGLTDLSNLSSAQEQLLADCIADSCMGIINQGIDEVSQASCQSLLTQMEQQVSEGGVYFEQSSFQQDVIHLLANLTQPQQDLLDSIANQCYNNAFDFDGNYNSAINALHDSIYYGSFFCPDIAEILVLAHPEYCHYEFCLATINSQSYDAQLKLVSDWNDAQSNTAYVCPVDLSYLGSDFSVCSGQENDPYFFTGSPGDGYESQLQDSILNYAEINGTTYDMWSFFDINTSFSGGNTGSDLFYEGVNTANSDEVHNRHWQLFRDAYSGLKINLQAAYLQNNACNYLTAPYAVVTNPILPTNSNDIDASANGQIADFSAALCNGNVQAWGNVLEDVCGVSSDTFDLFIADSLMAYCQENSGMGNPLGILFSEDLATDTRLQYVQNFLQIQYGCSNGLDTIATENPYSYLINGGDTVEYTQGIVSPCFYNLVDYLNATVFPDNSIYTSTLTRDYELDEQVSIESSIIYNCIEPCDPGVSPGCKEFAHKFVIRDHFISFGVSYPDCPSNGTNTSFYSLLGFYNLLTGNLVNPLEIQYISDITPTDVPGSMLSPLMVDLLLDATIYMLDGSVVQARIVAILKRIDQCHLPAATYTSSYIVTGVDSGYGANYSYQINFDSLQYDCWQQLVDEAYYYAVEEFQDSLDQILDTYLHQYTESCTDISEDFHVTYELNEYHYTLYYYDQAGNLTQTVPPLGVKPLDESHFSSTGIWDGTEPNHLLQTQYAYNTLNQVVRQHTPDGGTSQFWYDKKGLLSLSQNAQQKLDDAYSYTEYDEMGRIIEVGQFIDSSLSQQSDAFIQAQVYDSDFPHNISIVPEQVSYTEYGESFSSGLVENIRGRVAHSHTSDGHHTYFSYDEHGNVKHLKQEISGLGSKTIDYQYDLLSGNIHRIVYQKDEPEQFIHRYEYDADNRITNVYTSQDGYLWDEDAQYFYYHHGPLARTELGEDKLQGLDFQYTLHGWLKGVNVSQWHGEDTSPLDRHEANNAFSYMLGYYDGDYDPIGTSTPYYNDFWNDISTELNPAAYSDGTLGLFNGNIATMAMEIAPDLIDGTSGQHPFTGGAERYGIYKYDQLHRITQSTSKNSASGITQPTTTNYLTSQYEYDANGNITRLYRSDDNGVPFDDFTYLYNSDLNNQLVHVQDNDLYTNHLQTDIDNQEGTGPGGSYAIDFFTGNITQGNYEYDAIGNLVFDNSEDIDSIDWTVYGKVSAVIRKPESSKVDIRYQYDAFGNRITKTVIPKIPVWLVSGVPTYTQPASAPHPDYYEPASKSQWTTTYYVRDVQGNIMAMYEGISSDAIYEEFRDLPTHTGPDGPHIGDVFLVSNGNGIGTKLVEWPIYGNKRLGSKQADIALSSALNVQVYMMTGTLANTNEVLYAGVTQQGLSQHLDAATLALIMNHSDPIWHQRIPGSKQYELSNHLGNVQVVFSDQKAGIDTTGNLLADYYNLNIRSANDYYPFGMLMPGRTYISGNGYRWGFNGQEKDNDISGVDGGYVNFTFRIHDTRLGRFLSTDPLEKEYPWNSSYAFAENDVIRAMDLEGAERKFVMLWTEIKPDGAEVITDTKVLLLNSKPLQHPDGYKYAETILHIYGDDYFHEETHIELLDDDGNVLFQNAETGDFYVKQSGLKPSAAYDFSTKESRESFYEENGISWRYRATMTDAMWSYWSSAPDNWQRIEKVELYAEAALYALPYIRVGRGAVNAIKNIGNNAAKSSTQGGLNLFKSGASQTGKRVGWKTGDYMLYLPNKGTPKLNWKANYGAIRREMRLGKPIFDSYRLSNGDLIPTKGFLNAERSILQNRGWIYNSSKGAWMPPGF